MSTEVDVYLDLRMTGEDGIPDQDVVFIGGDQPYFLATIDKENHVINLRVGGERDHVLRELATLVHDAMLGIFEGEEVTEEEYIEYLNETFPEKLV